MKIRRAKREKTAAEIRKHHGKRGVRRSEPGGRMKSEETKLRAAKQAAEVLSLIVRGATQQMVADHLGIDKNTVAAIISRARAEYTKDIDELVQTNNAMVLARCDACMRAAMPRATGGFIENPKTGEMEWREPDPKFMAQVARFSEILISMNRSVMPQKMEITGANQGPVVTAAFDSMEAAALVRAEFGENAAITGAARGDYLDA